MSAKLSSGGLSGRCECFRTIPRWGTICDNRCFQIFEGIVRITELSVFFAIRAMPALRFRQNVNVADLGESWRTTRLLQADTTLRHLYLVKELVNLRV
jgi:hypothetical protein